MTIQHLFFNRFTKTIILWSSVCACVILSIAALTPIQSYALIEKGFSNNSGVPRVECDKQTDPKTAFCNITKDGGNRSETLKYSVLIENVTNDGDKYIKGTIKSITNCQVYIPGAGADGEKDVSNPACNGFFFRNVTYGREVRIPNDGQGNDPYWSSDVFDYIFAYPDKVVDSSGKVTDLAAKIGNSGVQCWNQKFFDENGNQIGISEGSTKAADSVYASARYRAIECGGSVGKTYIFDNKNGQSIIANESLSQITSISATNRATLQKAQPLGGTISGNNTTNSLALSAIEAAKAKVTEIENKIKQRVPTVKCEPVINMTRQDQTTFEAVYSCFTEENGVKTYYGPDGNKLAAECVAFTYGISSDGKTVDTASVKNACVSAQLLGTYKTQGINSNETNVTTAGGGDSNSGEKLLGILFNIVAYILAIIMYILGSFAQAILTFLSVIFIFLLSLNPADPLYIDAASKPWQVIIGLANLVTLSTFIAAGLGYILNIESFKVKLQQFILNIAIFSLLLQFTLQGSALFINVANGLGDVLIGAYAGVQNGQPDRRNLITFMSNSINTISIIRCGEWNESSQQYQLKQEGSDPECVTNGDKTNTNLGDSFANVGEDLKNIGGAMGDILSGSVSSRPVQLFIMEGVFFLTALYAIFLMFSGVKYVMFRVVGLWLLMVVSPLALGVYFSPFKSIKKYGSEWMDKFWRLSLAYPVFILGLVIVSRLVSSFGRAVRQNLVTGTTTNAVNTPNPVTAFLSPISTYAATNSTTERALLLFISAVLIAVVSIGAFSLLLTFMESVFGALAKALLDGIKSAYGKVTGVGKSLVSGYKTLQKGVKGLGYLTSIPTRGIGWAVKGAATKIQNEFDKRSQSQISQIDAEIEQARLAGDSRKVRELEAKKKSIQEKMARRQGFANTVRGFGSAVEMMGNTPYYLASLMNVPGSAWKGLSNASKKNAAQATSDADVTLEYLLRNLGYGNANLYNMLGLGNGDDLTAFHGATKSEMNANFASIRASKSQSAANKIQPDIAMDDRFKNARTQDLMGAGANHKYDTNEIEFLVQAFKDPKFIREFTLNDDLLKQVQGNFFSLPEELQKQFREKLPQFLPSEEMRSETFAALFSSEQWRRDNDWQSMIASNPELYRIASQIDPKAVQELDMLKTMTPSSVVDSSISDNRSQDISQFARAAEQYGFDISTLISTASGRAALTADGVKLQQALIGGVRKGSQLSPESLLTSIHRKMINGQFNSTDAEIAQELDTALASKLFSAQFARGLTSLDSQTIKSYLAEFPKTPEGIAQLKRSSEIAAEVLKQPGMSDLDINAQRFAVEKAMQEALDIHEKVRSRNIEALARELPNLEKNAQSFRAAQIPHKSSQSVFEELSRASGQASIFGAEIPSAQNAEQLSQILNTRAELASAIYEAAGVTDVISGMKNMAAYQIKGGQQVFDFINGDVSKGLDGLSEKRAEQFRQQLGQYLAKKAEMNGRSANGEDVAALSQEIQKIQDHINSEYAQTVAQEFFNTQADNMLNQAHNIGLEKVSQVIQAHEPLSEARNLATQAKQNSETDAERASKHVSAAQFSQDVLKRTAQNTTRSAQNASQPIARSNTQIQPPTRQVQPPTGQTST